MADVLSTAVGSGPQWPSSESWFPVILFSENYPPFIASSATNLRYMNKYCVQHF